MQNSLLVLAAWLVLAAPALALAPEAPLPDPAQEARAKALFYELRCVVCAGESVADSPAQVAGDVRREVRERVAAGESDDAILALMAQHYGSGILMTPPLSGATIALWLGPLAMLLLAGLLAARYFRNSREVQ
ncbi:MAG: cytochrome c-type biogenesis protein CcmH [Alphaproteobacteria bacterium]|nr:cytochrome c-type biogenesis protein CcmH [Alphaproteobacteria bacterium]